MKYVYAVKANVFADPFMVCPTLEDAIDAACALHHEMDTEDRMSMILRLPVFSGVKIIDPTSDNSEEAVQ